MTGPVVREASGAEDMARVRALFREYADWLKVDLCFQGFDAELASLPGAYARPDGRLFLAMDGIEAAGCIALRRFDADAGEVKRLYVRPAWRGRGLGERLAQAVVDAAREIGYRRLLLDTLDHMQAARALYARAGFREIAAYYHNPLPGAVYMEKSLQGSSDSIAG
jgi:ribosomal protein S18 acetylase RimI-like enzyme